MEIFSEIAIILAVTILVVYIMKFLKQPLIIAYIISGILLGPNVLNLIRSTESLQIFSEIGISFLLFLVGLGLNPKIIKDVGKISLITGLGQVFFTTIIGLFGALALGFSITEAAYIAIGLTFSSTIIIMKILSDKQDTDKLYGKISIGFLIVQDFVAMFILMIVSATGNTEGNLVLLIAQTLLKGCVAIGIIFLIGLYLLPKFLKTVAKSQEFLLLFSIGWCLALASIFELLGLSVEIGALLAGITLSMSPFRFEISSKMRPLRDFFIILFFITLGSQMVFETVLDNVLPIVVLSLFVLIGNPLIVLILMGSVLGYTKRNSFLCGLTVAQISEFSLILVTLGVTLGHISRDLLSIFTVIGLITIAGSTYAMVYSEKLYLKLSKILSIFEKKGKKKDESIIDFSDGKEVILFGCHRMGSDLIRVFHKSKSDFVIVDYNPEVIKELNSQNIESIYGDISDTEFLDELKLDKTKMIVSSIPDFETNLLLIDKVRKQNHDCILILTSHKLDEAIELYKKGATYVVTPSFLGGHHTASLIEKYSLSNHHFKSEGEKHLESLELRKNSI
jgi:Kef-type K+ transport system membrane component KefB/Trk K+ transport system NAD-binding subunit